MPRTAAATGTRAFQGEPGVDATDLDDLSAGGDLSIAFGINEAGEVVAYGSAATMPLLRPLLRPLLFCGTRRALIDLNDLIADGLR